MALHRGHAGLGESVLFTGVVMSLVESIHVRNPVLIPMRRTARNLGLNLYEFCVPDGCAFVLLRIYASGRWVGDEILRRIEVDGKSRQVEVSLLSVSSTPKRLRGAAVLGLPTIRQSIVFQIADSVDEPDNLISLSGSMISPVPVK
jgi:hypothetical protein